MSKNIKIKYKDSSIIKLEKMAVGDWIDLRAAEDIVIEKNSFKLIPLGVAMELPKGYEAHMAPRSSTFKNYKITQTNSVGVIDSSYCGDDDYWFFPAYAHENTEIKKGDRVCQFRIMKRQPSINFIEVEHLNNPNRGGHGSTGKK